MTRVAQEGIARPFVMLWLRKNLQDNFFHRVRILILSCSRIFSLCLEPKSQISVERCREMLSPLFIKLISIKLHGNSHMMTKIYEQLLYSSAGTT